MTRVAINGFGRIGRLVARAILERPDCGLELVSVNDLADAKANAWLFSHDSVHGKFPGKVVHADELEPAIGPFEDGARDQPADAAEAVDCNSRHWIPRSFMESVTRAATLSGVRPKKA